MNLILLLKEVEVESLVGIAAAAEWKLIGVLPLEELSPLGLAVGVAGAPLLGVSFVGVSPHCGHAQLLWPLRFDWLLIFPFEV